MLGAIIAAPLAIAPTTARPDSNSTSTAQLFGTVSVVMIASAAVAPPSSDNAATICGMPASILSIGSGTPIKPVEQTSTSSVCKPNSLAVRAHIRRAWSKPTSPLQKLALPLLRMTARALPSARCSRSMAIDAPCTLLVVYTAAAFAGRVEYTSAKSLAPDSLTPAWMPAARYPLGAVTPPPSITLIALSPFPSRRQTA